MWKLIFVASWVVLSVARPSDGLAQSQCRAADSVTAAQISVVHDMMTRTESRWTATKAAYQLPTVSDSAIVVVADSSVCAQAAAAYNVALPSDLRVTGRSVYVVRVGATRYLVWDPTRDSGNDEYDVVIVLDSAFSLLASFAT